MQKIFPFLILLFATVCHAPFAHAGQCSNPAKDEGVIIYNNDFHVMQYCNGTKWLEMDGGGAGGGGMALISTQTVTNAASLQFTDLSGSYDTVFLSCGGLVVSDASKTLFLRIGEGATPTWETGAHYTITNQSNYGSGVVTNATDLLVAGPTLSTTVPTAIETYIHNIGSSTLYKVANTTALFTAGSPATYLLSSYWNNDTNPVTGIQLAMSGGTFSGKCSLYDVN